MASSPIPNKSGWGKRKRASGTGPNARKKHAERSFRGERTWQSFPARKSPGMGCGFFLFRGPSITHVEWCRTKQPGQLPKPSLHNQRNNTIIHLILKMGLEPPELHRRAPGSDDCIRGKAVRLRLTSEPMSVPASAGLRGGGTAPLPCRPGTMPPEGQPNGVL